MDSEKLPNPEKVRRRIKRGEISFGGKRYFSSDLDSCSGCFFEFDPTQNAADDRMVGSVDGKKFTLRVSDVRVFPVDVIEAVRRSRAEKRQALLEEKARRS